MKHFSTGNISRFNFLSLLLLYLSSSPLPYFPLTPNTMFIMFYFTTYFLTLISVLGPTSPLCGYMVDSPSYLHVFAHMFYPTSKTLFNPVLLSLKGKFTQQNVAKWSLFIDPSIRLFNIHLTQGSVLVLRK